MDTYNIPLVDTIYTTKITYFKKKRDDTIDYRPLLNKTRVAYDIFTPYLNTININPKYYLQNILTKKLEIMNSTSFQESSVRMITGDNSI